ncbi:MAG TPA: penicillin acylase family protein [Pyrinomonadaceae bacterium]|nr:penicillin acylase family protein [Pyrinomonadaceae bacterium]
MIADAAQLKPKLSTLSIALPSLRDEVTIRRDERGIPFIDATNEADLYFAQGYATASDRLWQMDFLRRTARGLLAEVFGPGAVEVDKLHRTYGFTLVAEKLLARAPAKTREVLESYARGVNAFITQCDAKSLPLEFQVLQYQPKEWATIDSIVLGKLFAQQLSFTVDADILRALLSDLPSERFELLLPQSSPLDLLEERYRPYEKHEFGAEERAILTGILKRMRRSRAASSSDGEVGSNSWVVSGDMSVSGKPLLASDPHLPPTSPSIWHIVHLNAPDVRVAGVAVPGVPGVMIGHNEWIAWGVTNLCPDVQDLYFEQFDCGDTDLYKTPAGWRAADVRNEEIVVRNPKGAKPDSVSFEIKVTRHGPVILESGSLGLSLRWTALDADVIDLDTFLTINRARNWNEFTGALKSYGGPPQTFTYADTAGHIGYYSAGRIPVRRSGDGSLPYDGRTDDGEWLGFIPFDDLPHAFDPPSRQVVSANQRVVNDAYPYHLTHNWRVPYRARRIHDLLQTKAKFDVGDFLDIQADTYSFPDAIFAAQLVKLGQRFADTSTEWHDLVEMLDGWDGLSSSHSTVLPLVAEIRKAFRNQILEAAIGTERTELYEWRNEGTFIDKLITEKSKEWLPADFVSYDALLLACYREAIDALTKQLGADRDQWTWGNLAQVRFPHPLERLGPAGQRFATRALPQNADGSMPTVNAGARVSLRFIADLSNWDATRLCLPLGESGDPRSPNRDDQLDEWYNVTPSILPFSETAIADATRNVQILVPE